ncbi:MAG: hypothetical protein JNK82_26020 [Myxococcaceae bacterium]|nr:hypothetical protein [Myxococcaceae bacterium]
MKTLLPLLLLALSVPAFAQTTAGDVKKETGEAVDATKRYANEKKDEFEARMEAKLKAIKDEMIAAKENVKAKTKDTADATARDLDAKAKKADAKFAEVKKASGNAWSKLKGGVESAVDELEKGVENAKAK